MVDKRKPRKGSMAFRPRKRAKSENVRLWWPERAEKRLLGIPGYKVGMTNVAYIDPTESPTKGQEIVSAATIIEVPPVLVYGIRYYDDKNSIGEIHTDNETVLKASGIRKKKENKNINMNEVKEIRLLVCTQPQKTGLGKKKAEFMELACGGKDIKEKIEYAQSLLGKEIRVSEIFKPGEFVDVSAVTKGKGWQGPVKRFGVAIQRRKATGKRRHVGTLGPFHPAIVAYTVPQAGQMGYHTRTEFNKMIIKIGTNPADINIKSGYPHYGVVKNDYIILKGSVPGPTKRLVKIRVSARNTKPADVKLTAISTEPR
ncbi:MAG: 50S ribosomal protein L3 [Candidatus Bilamarchaeaceae archaeon]